MRVRHTFGGMRDKSENVGGIRDDSNFKGFNGCEMKKIRRERDLLILAGGMRDGFKIDGEMWENRKSHVTDVTR